MNNNGFIHCEKCHKRLIRRLPNGIFEFKFGRRREETNKEPVVHIQIYGSIRIRCMRDDCKHWNVFNFFPEPYSDVTQTGKPKLQPLGESSPLKEDNKL